MLTKAIIRRLNTDKDNHFRVYIPLLRKANNTEEDATLDATLIYIRGLENTFKVGDIVFIDFENNQYSNPVILGLLYLGKEDEDNITTNATFKSIHTLESTRLTENTIIGNLDVVDINKKINGVLDNNHLNSSNVIYDSSLTEDQGKLTAVNVSDALDELAKKIKN